MLRQILHKIGAIIRAEGAMKVDSKKSMACLGIEIHSKEDNKDMLEV
jgi:hypothetical protein